MYGTIFFSNYNFKIAFVNQFNETQNVTFQTKILLIIKLNLIHLNNI